MRPRTFALSFWVLLSSVKLIFCSFERAHRPLNSSSSRLVQQQNSNQQQHHLRPFELPRVLSRRKQDGKTKQQGRFYWWGKPAMVEPTWDPGSSWLEPEPLFLFIPGLHTCLGNWTVYWLSCGHFCFFFLIIVEWTCHYESMSHINKKFKRCLWIQESLSQCPVKATYNGLDR